MLKNQSNWLSFIPVTSASGKHEYPKSAVPWDYKILIGITPKKNRTH